MKPPVVPQGRVGTSAVCRDRVALGRRFSRYTPASRLTLFLVCIGLFGSPVLFRVIAVESSPPPPAAGSNIKSFAVTGVITKLEPDGGGIVVRHEAIPGYMDAMTMPFKAERPEELKGLQSGDRISFRLEVSDAESWIGEIRKTGTVRPGGDPAERPVSSAAAPAAHPGHPLLDFKFTNELGQPVSLCDFRGQALAIAFFFTRCPVPDYCPRLSKNFEEASRQLASRPGAPTNWHFLSVSFDTAFDTPAVLRAYGNRYHYDPAHWSFLTGPKEEINELAEFSGVMVDPDAGLFNHNFRTLIIDPAGRLQTSFPFGGNLSDAIVGEILKACAGSNTIVAGDTNGGVASSTPRIVSSQTSETGNRRP